MPTYRPVTERTLAEFDALPLFRKTAFRCPTCSVMAQMRWLYLSPIEMKLTDTLDGIREHSAAVFNSQQWFYAALCQAKGCVSIWMQQEDRVVAMKHKAKTEVDTKQITDVMVYPRTNAAPPPPGDLPESAKELYVEAGNVMADSPRAAAALLRMCTEDIIKELTRTRDARKTLSKKARLYQHVEFLRNNDELWPGGAIDTGLDALIFIGNDAVHSTEIRGDDDRSTVEGLFRLIHMITHMLITRRREAHEFEQLISKTDH